MFKIFRGFHLVEEYQKKKKERRLSDDKTLSQTIKIIAAVGISLMFLRTEIQCHPDAR